MWPRGKESLRAPDTPRNLTALIAKGMAVGSLAWPNPSKEPTRLKAEEGITDSCGPWKLSATSPPRMASAYLEVGENSLDPCGLRKLSATPSKGGRELPWLTRVGRFSPTPSRKSARFEGRKTILTMDKPRELTSLSLETRPEQPERRQSRLVGEKRVGMLAPVTARCKVGLVGLLRGRSRHTWVIPNVPSPGCSGIVVRCSEIVVVSVSYGNAPKVRRETFVTTETYFGETEPSSGRLSEACSPTLVVPGCL
ncbi:hypothetical protein CRG98_015087 [Punica granatum]|uniref:Uncharacterized protein n=1 Tax=Punica granatum TaxID=22663 RepID=A0A2I0K7K0_PUNGR|nr:hypothetical protein CRG98_015087 [Punica granatum]